MAWPLARCIANLTAGDDQSALDEAPESNEDLHALAEALEVTGTPWVSVSGCCFGDSGIQLLADAISKNENGGAQALYMDRCDFGDDGLVAIANMLTQRQDMKEFHIWCNRFSEDSLRNVLQIASKHNGLTKLVLVRDDYCDFSPNTKQAIVDLKFAKPDIELGEGLHGEQLMLDLSPFLIWNIPCQKKVTDLQEHILQCFKRGENPGTSIQELVEVCSGESGRLTFFLMKVIDRYAGMGGHEFVLDIEVHGGSCKQAFPEGAERAAAGNMEAAVRYMLAVAAWQEPSFRKLLIRAVTALNRATDMNHFLELLAQDGVDGFEDVVIQNQTVHLSSCHLDYVNGAYHMKGFWQGTPYYVCEEQGMTLFFSSVWQFWNISSRGLDGDACGQNLTNDCSHVPTSDWMIAGEGWERVPEMSVELTSEDKKLSELELPGEVGSRCEILFGPPKNLARCLEKAEESNSAQALVDLNRATVKAEHPVILACAYHALVAATAQAGGKICRAKNKFRGPDNPRPYKQPPNIHLNLGMPQHGSEELWITEVQFAYGDILKVKEATHTYYELTRIGDDPANFLHPVFDVRPEELRGSKWPSGNA